MTPPPDETPGAGTAFPDAAPHSLLPATSVITTLGTDNHVMLLRPPKL